MNAPPERNHELTRRPATASGPARRIVTAIILSGFAFLLLWIMAFSLITSALISVSCCVVIVAASSISDVVEMVLDAIAAVVFGVLGMIAAAFAAIFGLFGF